MDEALDNKTNKATGYPVMMNGVLVTIFKSSGLQDGSRQLSHWHADKMQRCWFGILLRWYGILPLVTSWVQVYSLANGNVRCIVLEKGHRCTHNTACPQRHWKGKRGPLHEMDKVSHWIRKAFGAMPWRYTMCQHNTSCPYRKWSSTIPSQWKVLHWQSLHWVTCTKRVPSKALGIFAIVINLNEWLILRWDV